MILYDKDGDVIGELYEEQSRPESGVDIDVGVDEINREHDFSTKEGTIEAIRYECKMQGLPLDTQHSYVIATCDWETNHTFKPVKEAYWLSEQWRESNLKYYPYYGRGYVQITWKENYEKFGRILGYNLVGDPDRTLEPNVALFIMVYGFKHGTFTGKSLENYIDETGTNFMDARRCINGTDKAGEIALLAKDYLADISQGD